MNSVDYLKFVSYMNNVVICGQLIWWFEQAKKISKSL